MVAWAIGFLQDPRPPHSGAPRDSSNFTISKSSLSRASVSAVFRCLSLKVRSAPAFRSATTLLSSLELTANISALQPFSSFTLISALWLIKVLLFPGRLDRRQSSKRSFRQSLRPHIRSRVNQDPGYPRIFV